MVEPPNPLGVHPTSISYIYKVIQHLAKLWMGIWVHPYPFSVALVPGGWENFRKIRVWLSRSDVDMSWLRLQAQLECILHPYHMYTKCFSTFVCCGGAYGCALTLLCLCRPGVIFMKIGVGWSLSDVVMSWLRLQTHLELECIPHPYHIYKK